MANLTPRFTRSYIFSISVLIVKTFFPILFWVINVCNAHLHFLFFFFSQVLTPLKFLLWGFKMSPQNFKKKGRREVMVKAAPLQTPPYQVCLSRGSGREEQIKCLYTLPGWAERQLQVRLWNSPQRKHGIVPNTTPGVLVKHFAAL